MTIPSVAVRAAEWFRTNATDDWRTSCNDYFHRKNYDVKVWKSLFGRLRTGSRPLADALTSYAQSAEAKLRAAVAAAAKEAAAADAPLVALVAAAPDNTNAWPNAWDFCYQDYLYALCVRLVDTLREQDPGGSLTLLVPQSLGLEPAGGHWRLLEIPEVRTVTLKATPTCANGKSPHRLHISAVRKGWAGRPADWTADIVARQLTTRLRWNCPLRSIRRSLSSINITLGFADELPTITCVGPMFDRLEDCRAHNQASSPPPPIDTPAGWPTEQAQLWAGVVR